MEGVGLVVCLELVLPMAEGSDGECFVMKVALVQ